MDSYLCRGIKSLIMKQDNRITFIQFSSPLHDKGSVMEARGELYSLISSRFSLNIIDGAKIDKPIEDICICFIATGGTEEQFKRAFDYIPKPVIIISDSFHNSLAASREISSWLCDKGVKYCHINIPMSIDSYIEESIFPKIEEMTAVQEASMALKGKKIALIGDASPWLISSSPNTKVLEEFFGISFINIPINEIEERFNKMETPAEHEMSQFINFLEDRDSNDLVLAIRMYKAIKEAIEGVGADSVTIKCFDLLPTCKTTACLALALLNDSGIISGCEGDIPSLWSMMVATAISGKATFMSNPSSADPRDLSVDFAHCTIPLSLAPAFTLPSHFESQIGIGVRGNVSKGVYTLFKIAGENLQRYFVAQGEIVSNTHIAQRCRTQIKFKFKSKEDYENFMEASVSNHIIIVPGKVDDKLIGFMRNSYV